MNPAPSIESTARRPIRSRNARWASTAAGRLGRAGVSPNAISLASIAFSVAAGAALVATGCVVGSVGDAILFVVAVLGMQLRLVCNLLDGMVAVEGGKSSPVGEIYNDLPDRIADPVILVGAGYATLSAAGETPALIARWGVELGWLAAALALLTAYTRVLGRGIGGGIHFVGPMAKQHRMAVLTVACVASAVLSLGPQAGRRWSGVVVFAALAVISVGCVLTIVRRTRLISDTLNRTSTAAAPPPPAGGRSP